MPVPAIASRSSPRRNVRSSLRLPSSIKSRTCRSGWKRSTKTAAARPNNFMARAAAPSAPVCLIHGDDDYAVKQRARQLYQQWSEELGGMDHEIIDAQVANGGE